MEEKMRLLSKTIVDYSIEVKENDKVLITAETINSKKLVKILVEDIINRGGIPFVKIIDPELNTFIFSKTKPNRIEEIKKHKKFDVDNFDCFISIRYSENEYEDKNIPTDIRISVAKSTHESDEIRINERRWVLLNYPSKLDAFKAKMTTEEFEEYAFDVMTVDYKKMRSDLEPLKNLMEKTDKIRILAPNTDLTFSIKGMPIIPCVGDKNIPDGEIYTAPLKTSVNGIITYNTPCPYQGRVYNNVQLKFIDGKIISATCNENSEHLNGIFDSDKGSRYIGEFSIGTNKLITRPIGDILFDEKIGGSIHFTPGRAYKDSDNGNDSTIHWDMVLVEKSEFGGGELYFDDVLIRKDGLFVIDDLKHLN